MVESNLVRCVGTATPIVGDQKTVWSSGLMVTMLDRYDDGVSQYLLGLQSGHNESHVYALRSLLEFMESKAKPDVCNFYLLVSAIVFAESVFNISMEHEYKEFRRSARKPWKDKTLLADVAIWRKVFYTLQQINRLGAWAFPAPLFHPVLAVMRLANEGYLIGGLAKGADGMSSARGWVEGYRKDTEQLGKNKNPFPVGSFTHQFVQSCLDITAFKSVTRSAASAFEDDVWCHLLNARRDYLKIVQESNPVLIYTKTLEPVRAQVRTKRKTQKKSNPEP
jgi:hypothetical protein